MISPSDPLFWLIAAGLTLPWAVVVWLAFQLEAMIEKRDSWRDRCDDWRARHDDLVRSIPAVPVGFQLESPIIDQELPDNVIRLAGKHQRPRVVELPVKGKIS